MFRLLKISVWLLVLLWGLLVASIAVIFLTFVRFAAEEPVADIYFEKIADQQYNAYLTLPGHDIPDKFLIYGDQWRIDAQFVKIKPWANILGVDSRYRLTRLEGRYGRAEDQNTRPHMAYDLGTGAAGGFDPGGLVARWNVLLDAEYGSSAFSEMTTSDRFGVFKSQSGLLIRKTPIDALADDSDGIIDRALHWLFGRDS